MRAEVNRAISKVGPHVVDFAATVLLAGIWSDLGIKVWRDVRWYWALMIWLVTLCPVFLGYYMGRVLEDLRTELNLLVEKNVGEKPTLDKLNFTRASYLDELLKNRKYERLWCEMACFIGLIFADLYMAIRLSIMRVLE